MLRGGSYQTVLLFQPGSRLAGQEQEVVRRLAVHIDDLIPMSVLLIGYPAEQQVSKDKWVPEKVHWNGY